MSQAPMSDDWDQHWSEMHGSARLNPAQDFRRRLLLDQLPVFARRARSLSDFSTSAAVRETSPGSSKTFSPMASTWESTSASWALKSAAARCPMLSSSSRTCSPPVRSKPATWAGRRSLICSEVLEHVDAPERNLGECQTLPSPFRVSDRHGSGRADVGVRPPHRASSAFYEPEPGFLAGADRLRRAVCVWRGLPLFNLYRLTVLARGKKLVDDASHAEGMLPFASRAAMTMYGVLFRLNRYQSKRGWQRVAVATHASPSLVAGAPSTTACGVKGPCP